MKLVRKVLISNFTFFFISLFIVFLLVYILGITFFQEQIHETSLVILDNTIHLLEGHDEVKLNPSDGVFLLLDNNKNLVSSFGLEFSSQGFASLNDENISNKIDFISGKQGKLYDFNNIKYFLYHQISETGMNVVYLREKNISEVSLIKFRNTLLIAFTGLVLIFFFVQDKTARKLAEPLEKLARKIKFQFKSDQHRDPVSIYRHNYENEIDFISAYLEQTKDIVNDQDHKLRQHLFNVMDILVSLLEIKDSYTASHSKQVRKYAIAVAQMMGLSVEEIRDIAFAATLHDIGKIGVAHNILNKPGKLTSQEFKIIKQHPVVADDVLKSIKELNYIRNIIRHHHERFDGTGYPDQLAGEDIPFEARIISVADAFDAMTSDRPYRKALKFKDAIDIMIEEKGKQFDSDIVDSLLKYLYSQKLYEKELAPTANHIT
ncbi:MAG: HD-GYP domain-containing protein [Halanaerobiales bacterium]|nr:HD-GYP domain-containing protein [Halanaerobiales bacterium]